MGFAWLYNSLLSQVLFGFGTLTHKDSTCFLTFVFVLSSWRPLNHNQHGPSVFGPRLFYGRAIVAGLWPNAPRAPEIATEQLFNADVWLRTCGWRWWQAIRRGSCTIRGRICRHLPVGLCHCSEQHLSRALGAQQQLELCLWCWSTSLVRSQEHIWILLFQWPPDWRVKFHGGQSWRTPCCKLQQDLLQAWHAMELFQMRMGVAPVAPFQFWEAAFLELLFTTMLVFVILSVTASRTGLANNSWMHISCRKNLLCSILLCGQIQSTRMKLNWTRCASVCMV